MSDMKSLLWPDGVTRLEEALFTTPSKFPQNTSEVNLTRYVIEVWATTTDLTKKDRPSSPRLWVARHRSVLAPAHQDRSLRGCSGLHGCPARKYKTLTSKLTYQRAEAARYSQ